MDIFTLAHMQLEREGKAETYHMSELLDKAITIRKYLDKRETKKARTQFKKISV